MHSPVAVIFIHCGDSDYLRYSLAQARYSNPKSHIYLIGDGSTINKYPDAEHIMYSDYVTTARKFEKAYRHMNTNSRSFELLCMMRWFILQDFMQLNNITSAVYLDSDIMLYEEIHYERYRCYDYDLAVTGVAPPVLVNNIRALEAFCSFLEKSYSDKVTMSKLEERFQLMQVEGRPGGICDMTFWELFVADTNFKVIDWSLQIDDAVYDRNIHLSDGFEMDNGLKKVVWCGNRPCGIWETDRSMVRFKGLHFHGYAKEVMGAYLAASEQLQVDMPMLQSPLDKIIPPEIRDDEFYHLLRDLTAREPIMTALEIGSSSGDGSTEALVEGLSRNRTRPMLFCLEASRSRFCQLSERYAHTQFVRCLNVSSVTIDKFPAESAVEFFWHNRKTNLSLYPLATVINWLREDIRYLKESGVEQGGIAKIKNSYSVERFDLVLIDGSEFTGEAELDELIGARWIALDDVNAYKNFHNYQRLSNDPDYTLIAENWQLRNGYALFRHREAPLPVHFFTIVLNGMPFISHHIDAFKHLPFRWHWHIVEGAAELVADTAWSRPNGGYLPESFHYDGLSIDGTSEYIDQLKLFFPDNITVYRKPAGELWQGKLAMVNAPLDSILEECLLWEINADECWSHAQLCDGWRMFQDEPERSAAFYRCHFFVGPHLVVSSRNCYSQQPGHEWLRTWRYRPGCRWAAHEPPRLICCGSDGERDIARKAPFSNGETEAKGLVFQHFAYTTVDQVRFKEKYYGYSQATYGWLQLQKERTFSVRLGDYLPWVPDGTTVDTVSSQGIIRQPIVSNLSRQKQITGGPIIIDGVFFQYSVTGIARVWLALLEELSGTGFASKIVILDRGKTIPRMAGYHYLDFSLHNESNITEERKKLQRVCDELSAALFISTWHTSPLSTPSLLIVYDMLPEILLGEQRFEAGRWLEKKLAMEHAQAFVTISENTAKDMVIWYPETGLRSIQIMHLGVTPIFRPATPEQINLFKKAHGITKPYFLFVGPREWYKNFRLLLDAFLLLPEPHAYCIVSPHGEKLEEEFATHPGSAFVRLTGRLSDEDLVTAYSGAVALVYPSLYEGFGLPPLEAMACGCPVITSTAPAMLEVCGDAAIQVKADDCEALANALINLKNQELRVRHIRLGLERASRYSWKQSASQLQCAISSLLGGRMI